jgi:hypothetical protein
VLDVEDTLIVVEESGAAFETNPTTSDNPDLVASWCRDRGNEFFRK